MASSNRRPCPSPTHANCVIFVHVPKTGGQTLNSIIARTRRYRRDQTLTSAGAIRLPTIPEDKRQSLRLINGPIYYGIHEQLRVPWTYVTFLRSPVPRVASLFRYIVANPKHPLHEYVRHMSIEEFVISGIDRLEVENGQTRQLSGSVEGPSSDAMLEAAKQHLERDFLVVGITERFDESLLLLRRSLGWPLPLYRVRNRTKTTKSELSREASHLIAAQNALDLDLYGFGVELLKRQLSDQGPLFPAWLAAFRVLNRAAQACRSVIGAVRP